VVLIVVTIWCTDGKNGPDFSGIAPGCPLKEERERPRNGAKAEKNAL